MTDLERQCVTAYRRLPLEYATEATRLAREWIRAEDTDTYWIGCPDWADRPALIFTVEAARHITAMEPTQAKRLLRMALAELESPTLDRHHCPQLPGGSGLPPNQSPNRATSARPTLPTGQPGTDRERNRPSKREGCQQQTENPTPHPLEHARAGLGAVSPTP